jgi:hypothetical protein
MTPIVGAGAETMFLRRCYPSRRVSVADELEEPSKKSKTITMPEAKACCVNCEPVSECAGVVMGPADRIGDEVSDCIGVLTIEEEV